MADIFKLHAQIDEMLAGIPDATRMKASADILTVLLRAQRETERAIRDQEVADLLHVGWEPLADRFGVCKATVYNMAARGRASRKNQAA